METEEYRQARREVLIAARLLRRDAEFILHSDLLNISGSASNLQDSITRFDKCHEQMVELKNRDKQ